ncbi:hypothetical protein HaLaN_06101 [Haematococcus lacustris]|uniref:Uncharacterized protein n=1 Tax=Haematococcus lacustris TaxID=44745 RepID=A0A699YN41_HAELA|nr:hypothetical protein HaLaN_06101 [Haematococcus lacustris]
MATPARGAVDAGTVVEEAELPTAAAQQLLKECQLREEWRTAREAALLQQVQGLAFLPTAAGPAVALAWSCQVGGHGKCTATISVVVRILSCPGPAADACCHTGPHHQGMHLTRPRPPASAPALPWLVRVTSPQPRPQQHLKPRATWHVEPEPNHQTAPQGGQQQVASSASRAHHQPHAS